MKKKKIILAICIFFLIAAVITGCRPAERPIPQEPAPAPGQQPRDVGPEEVIPGERAPRELAPGDPARENQQAPNGTLREGETPDGALEEPIPQS